MSSDWYEECGARFAAEEELFGDRKRVNQIVPLVSVCVTTFQHGGFIRDCLDGILSQETDFPFEVIVGEDESTDGTRAVCIEYARNHPDRIRLFLRSRQRSVFVDGKRARYFNSRWCLYSARGKYVAICEGDDYWTDPRKLQRQVDILESRQDVSLCCHRVEMGAERGKGFEYPAAARPFINTLADIITDNWIPTCSIVVKRDIAVERREWASNVAFTDYPLQVTAAQRGDVAFVDAVMGFYRVHPGGSWSKLDAITRLEQLLTFYAALQDQVPAPYWGRIVKPKIARLRIELAKEHLASGSLWRVAREVLRAQMADPLRVWPVTRLKHRPWAR